MSSVTIRPFATHDLEGIQALINAVYGEGRVPSNVWRWRHLRIPAASGTMVAIQQGGVVGQQPMEIFDFSLDGLPLRGAVLTGVMVHPDYRKQGIFSAMLRVCEREAWRQGADFVTSMPNGQSVVGFERLGYCNPGPRTLVVRPLIPGAAGHVLAQVTRRAGVRLRRVATRQHAPVQEAYELSSSNLEAQFDALADALTASHSTLLLRRDSRWLRWRYAEAPTRRYRLFTVRQDGALAGWATCTVESRRGLRVGFLVDLVATSSVLRRSLAASVVRALAAAGAVVAVSVVSAPSLLGDLRRCGFMRVPRRLSPKAFHTVVRLHPQREQALQGLRSITNWYQTLGDWDTI